MCDEENNKQYKIVVANLDKKYTEVETKVLYKYYFNHIYNLIAN